MGFDVPANHLHDVIYTSDMGQAVQNVRTGRLTLKPDNIYRLM